MTHLFPDRRHELFGREPDVAHLLARCRHKGLTAVTGRPRSGKSWLLVEVARRLQGMGFLVGRAESTGEQPDLLLRTVSDAYARWLAEATAAGQAKSLFERHKDQLVGMAGEAVGEILKPLSSVLGWKEAGELASKAFAGLAAANRDLKSGGIELPRLGYDQARDLVNVLARVSDKDVVLILDAWEKTPAGAREAAMLSTYLGHLDDWPDGHLLLGVRVEGEGDEKVRDIRRLVSGSADASEYVLGGMHLEGEAERRRLVQHVRGEVKGAAEGVEDDTILGWVDAYPGVVEWWGRRAVLERLKSSDDMEAEAADAQLGRYGPELERLLRPLHRDRRELFSLATRLALLPEFVDEAGWDALRPVALAGTGEPALADLQVLGFLESAADERYPSFGHSTRREAVAEWLLKEMSPLVRVVAEDLVHELAGRIQVISEAAKPVAAALVDLRPAVRRCNASRIALALTECAASLFPEHRESYEPKLLAGLGREIDETRAALLAMGLFNSLCELSRAGDREGWEALLTELRELAGRFPDDAVVHRHLATGLFNSLKACSTQGDWKGSEALLREMKELAGTYLDDAAVREVLAKGFADSLVDYSEQGNPDKRETLLLELWELADGYPEDGAVRERLGIAMAYCLDARSKEGDREGREALLAKLRELAGSYPQDRAVRKAFALGLFNSILPRSEEGDHQGREALLTELRQLAARYYGDWVVRELLAMGLVNSLHISLEEGDRDRQQLLLGHLRYLALMHPVDGAVGEQLARGLFNVLARSEQVGQEGRQALLAELDELARKHPDEEMVVEALHQGRAVAESDGGDEGSAGGERKV